jgi:hypothetical protein
MTRATCAAFEFWENPLKTPWAIILCKFSDGDSEPFPLQYYKDLFTPADVGSKWNMVKFFNECAHGAIDVSGSQVFGWFKLNKTVADYNSLGGSARAALIGWARAAAVAAGHDLSPFYSTVACTNLWGDIGASGYGAVGQIKAPPALGVVGQGLTPTPAILGQEMGHVYGLQHSRRDGTTMDYTDQWDMMSGYNDYAALDGEFASIGPAYNAWNLRYMKWLDESRVWKGPDGAYDQTITLRPITRRDLQGFLAVEMPGGLLFEFREQAGWDGAIPRPAVLVHSFDQGHSYLMTGNLGAPDLIAGDSYGAPIPQGVPTLSGFQRVDVIAIDPAAPSATLRIRYKPGSKATSVAAVDPISLILSGAAYIAWAEGHNPHVPDIANLAATLRSMPAEARSLAVARAGVLAETANAVLAAARTIG